MGSKAPFVTDAPATAGKTGASAPSATRPATGQPAEEQIAVRAYELFLQEGCVHGRDLEHWLRAEEELRLRKKS